MVRVLIALALATVWVPVGHAQSLDVGGIDLRLGQDVPGALKSLSAYDVQYYDQMDAWFVVQKKGEFSESLGGFSATNNRVSYISKTYTISDVGDTARVYTRAAKDVRQRGGANCSVRDVVFTDDLIHEVETRCGLYKLTYSFPHTIDKARSLSAGISITLGGKR